MPGYDHSPRFIFIEVIIIILAVYASSEYLCYGSTAIMICLIHLARWSILYVTNEVLSQSPR